MPKPTGYTTTQIALHWIIFLLVAAQFVFHDAILEAWNQIARGETPAFSWLVSGHVFGGILILLLVIWRITIKIKRGSPALPEDESRALQIIGHATHGLLYLLLILVPISGLSAWFLNVGLAAQAHSLMKLPFLVLIALHLAGAIYQRVVLKSGVMERMVRPE